MIKTSILNTQHKNSAACHDADINISGKTWLCLNLSIVHGLTVTVMASQSKGRELESQCGQKF